MSVAAALVLALLIVIIQTQPGSQPEYDPQRYPAKALSVLRADPSSKIFTDDEWGDYLVYNLYPATRYLWTAVTTFTGRTLKKNTLM